MPVGILDYGEQTISILVGFSLRSQGVAAIPQKIVATPGIGKTIRRNPVVYVHKRKKKIPVDACQFRIPHSVRDIFDLLHERVDFLTPEHRTVGSADFHIVADARMRNHSVHSRP